MKQGVYTATVMTYGSAMNETLIDYVIRQVVLTLGIATWLGAFAWLITGEHQPSLMIGAVFGGTTIAVIRGIGQFNS